MSSASSHELLFTWVYGLVCVGARATLYVIKRNFSPALYVKIKGILRVSLVTLMPVNQDFLEILVV